MFSSKNIVKYLLVFVFSQFLIVDMSLANPIPVFCFAGWIDKCKVDSTKTSISEYDNKTYHKLKFYSISGNEISEYDNKTYHKLKFYN